MNTLREELDDLQDRLFRLLSNPEATDQDKASIVLANTSLSTIRERRKGRWPARAPRELPRCETGRKPVGDWALDWERAQEASHA